ncbi:MAG: MerR family transcriptional regulator [Nannocystales bacterium]
MSEGRTIGRLAVEAGVNVETIRFYERRGLIRQPESPTSGWRRYGEEVLRRIRFITRAQQLGSSLDDVEEMLALRGSRSEA